MILKLKNTIFAFSLVALLAGCGKFDLVPAGNVSVEGGISVNSDIAWSRLKAGKYEIWTLDGTRLQQMYFAGGLEEGRPIFHGLPSGSDEKTPRYFKNMNPIELKELFEASLVRTKAEKVKVTSFKPATFGAVPGYDLKFSYSLKEGLEMLGIGVLAIKDEEFYMALYVGSKLYHFDRNVANARKILRSISFAKSKSGWSLF